MNMHCYTVNSYYSLKIALTGLEFFKVIFTLFNFPVLYKWKKFIQELIIALYLNYKTIFLKFEKDMKNILPFVIRSYVFCSIYLHSLRRCLCSHLNFFPSSIHQQLIFDHSKMIHWQRLYQQNGECIQEYFEKGDELFNLN